MENDVSESASESSEEEGYVGEVHPYMFEPVMSSGSSKFAQKRSTSTGAGLFTGRVATEDISSWCTCKHCVVMDTDDECRCCQEIPQVAKKWTEIDDGDHAEQPECMTLHPGFESVALKPWNLQAVYNTYRQQYGDTEHHELHERYRYTAYRHFVSWCWGYVGKHVRVVLPACVVNSIRTAFPSEHYRGFKLPELN